jgi:hypothetical protein
MFRIMFHPIYVPYFIRATILGLVAFIILIFPIILLFNNYPYCSLRIYDFIY